MTNNPSEQLKQYLISVPGEKYIINTDREIYFINENIWYNIWSIDDITNIPVTRSKALYVELIGNDGDPLLQQTVLSENNLASGKLLIPYTISSGIYYLRAYSNWQKNFGSEFFGIKIIQIINPYNVPHNLELLPSKINITDFPEGGSLIQGVNNKVLVNARSENGNFADMGVISVTNQNDSIISVIKILSRGIGIFNLKPEKGQEYFLSDTADIRIPLILAEEGINVRLSSVSGILRVIVDGRTGKEGETFHILARNAGNVFFEKEFQFRDVPVSFEFSEQAIPEGLSDFSVVGGGDSLISQRLFFKRPVKKDIILDIIPEKPLFSVRDSVKIKISSPDFNKISLLSMTIHKKELSMPSLMPDLYTDALLHSNINDWDDFMQLELNVPADDNGDLINDYLISKTLTRYDWKSVLSGSKTDIKFFPETNVRHISGTATNPFTNEPLVRDKLLMYFVSQIPYILMTITDDQGRFTFSEPIKSISKQEVLIHSQRSAEGLSVKFDWPYFHEYYTYRLNNFFFDSLAFQALDEAYQKWQINMVHRDRIESLYKKTQADVMSSLYGPPDRRFYLKEYVQFNNMFEVFREIVDRVRIQRKDNNYMINVLDNEFYSSIGDNPLLLFNGHQIDNISIIMEIAVKDINFIDVIAERFYIGGNKYDGVINVVPYDVMIKAEVPRGSYRYVFDLINEKYNFKTRDYNKDKNNPLPDLRNTIYWNPDIKLNGPSEKIIFFSGDDTGEFELELKGIGINGELIQEKQIIHIK